MNTLHFKKGMRVRYIPTHVDRTYYATLRDRDLERVGIQDGVVSSTNDEWVFVKYDNQMMKMETGDEPYTAQATAPGDLIMLGGN